MSKFAQKRQFSMEERLVIIALLNDLMRTEKGDAFPLGPVAEFVEVLPYIPLQFKWPFVGNKKRGKDVEGYAPGIGNVSVPDTPVQSPREDPKKYPESRFGMWDVAHTTKGVYIDHMWSHHIMSPKYRNLCALLLVRRDAQGVIDAAILLKQPAETFEWELWKYSDNLSEEEVEAWMLKLVPPKPRIVGNLWLPVAIGACTFVWMEDIEALIVRHQIHVDFWTFMSVSLCLDLLNGLLGRHWGWKFSFGTTLVSTVIVAYLLRLAPHLM